MVLYHLSDLEYMFGFDGSAPAAILEAIFSCGVFLFLRHIEIL